MSELLLSMSFGLCWTWLPAVAAFDDAQTVADSFKRNQIPWFDATEDRLVPPVLPSRPAARSLDRANIPLAKEQDDSPINFGGGRGAGTAFADMMNYFLFLVLGLIFLVLVFVIVWAFLRADAKRKPNSAGKRKNRTWEESIEQLPFPIDQESGDFRFLAERAYQQGDYRRAVIYLFSYLLVAMDQSHLIRLRKGKTNRQYLRELKNEKIIAAYYARVMEPFEAVFYGEHSISKAEFEDCWGGLSEFQNSIGSRVQEAQG